jgi:DNA replication protein DnaC
MISDWSGWTPHNNKELLEILHDRYQSGSTIVTSQLDPEDWHAVIGDQTLADAICGQFVHYARSFKLGDESIRRSEGLTNAREPAK